MSVQTKSSAVEVAPARYKKLHHSYMDRTTTGEKVFSVFNYMVLAVLGIVTLFPFYIVIMKSFAPPNDFINKTIIWWPSKFELTYYKFILGTKSDFMMALKNSVFLVTVGTATNVVATFVAACVLAQKKLPFRNQITFIMVFTMFFGGGMIPGFILMKTIHLTNSLSGLIISGLLSTMYVLYLRNFIMTIPTDLIESAEIDGCPEYKIIYKIIFPLSLPALATFTLFYAVGQWNQFTGAILYISDNSKLPLQVYIQRLVASLTIQGDADELRKLMESGYKAPADALKATAIICSTIPIVMVYPFLQKYFVKGMMMGSLKG